MSVMEMLRQPSAAEYIANGPVMPKHEEQESGEADRYTHHGPPDFQARFHFLSLDNECNRDFTPTVV